MTSTIKVDNIQKVSDASNIIKKCSSTTTVGSGAGNTVVVCGSTVTIGRCGGTVALASGASQTGFGRTGTVDWQTTKKTGNFTAASGEGYFCDTSSGSFTLTLPSSPSAGDIVGLKDYALSFDTNALTIGRGGSPINGDNVIDPTVADEGASILLVYVDGTKGWIPTVDDTSSLRGGTDYIAATGGTETECGSYKIHTFTGPGTFTVQQVGPSSNGKVDYQIVAGGGSGGARPGTSDNPGGGGGGGFRESKCATTSGSWTASPLANPTSQPVSASPGSYPIVVGAGGAGVSPCGTTNPGNVSSAFGLSSAGGGGGGNYDSCGSVRSKPGGSGGGARGGGSTGNAGGTGNTPPVSPPQGQPGGGNSPSSPDQGGGGGGGATEAGVTGGPGPNGGGRGGAGATSNITGSPISRSGGGGSVCGAASPDGSGTAGNRSGSTTNAADNRGGGSGSAMSGGNSGNGGSGIVIIRYRFKA